MKRSIPSLIKGISTIVLGALTVIIFVGAVTIFILGMIAQQNNNTLRIFGYSYAIVATGSMEPVIKAGDFILYDNSKIEDVEIDDIIIFYSVINDKSICHRVVDIIYNDDVIELKTKGDANQARDDDIISSTSDNFYGKVIKIVPLFGIGKSILNYKQMIFVIVGFIFVVIIIKEVYVVKKQIFYAKAKKEQDEFLEKTKKEIYEELLEEMKNKKNE